MNNYLEMEFEDSFREQYKLVRTAREGLCRSAGSIVVTFRKLLLLNPLNASVFHWSAMAEEGDQEEAVGALPG